MADYQPKLTADEVLLAVADRVSTSNAPRRAGRIVLEELARVVWEHPEWLQGGWRFGARMCRGDSEPTSSHFASPAIEWDMRNQIINCFVRHNIGEYYGRRDSRCYHL